jgi:hypothetical protein
VFELFADGPYEDWTQGALLRVEPLKLPPERR